MSFSRSLAAAALLSLGALVPAGQASAADLAPLPVKAKPIIDVPFFLVNDNRLSYSYIFSGTDPGVFSVRPDGTINGKTAKQVYSFTHFDVWAYGTNFFTISAFKSDHNDPVSNCPAAQFGNCAGATEIYGLIRSTFGFNEIFGTKAFTFGPLRNVSFEIGADANTENNTIAPAKRDIVAGLQFAFDLPYKGFFNVAPLYYKEINHNQFLQCGTVFNSGIPGQTCLTDGNTDFKGTWAVEMNYYMDLGFLPPAVDYFSLSGRLAFYGKKGNSNAPLLTGAESAVEFNSEPIRLTFDASKAMFGAKYSHNVDVWVAYRYWQNKFGLDHNTNGACRLAGGTGASNNSCTESSLYSGVTVKF